MKCTQPYFIQNPYAKNPTMRAYGAKKFPRGLEVPCGKCLACRAQRANMWSIRLTHEITKWDDACFITLTYNNDHLPDRGSLKKEHLQLFFKRFRKNFKKKIKYFAAGEYGGQFNRPHYHVILFGYSKSHEIVDEFNNSMKGYLFDSWKFGNINIGSVSLQSCKYVTGYVVDKMDYDLLKNFDGMESPFQLVSQGLGLRTALENADKYVDTLGMTIEGVNYGLPRYYRKKLGLGYDDYKDIVLNKRIEIVSKLKAKGYSESDVEKEIEKSRLQSEATLRAKLSLKKQR